MEAVECACVPMGRGDGHGMTDTAGRLWHQPVMTAEVLEYLQPRPGITLVDATVGTAGHSVALMPRLLPDGTLIALDRDAEALAQARERLREFAPRVRFLHGNYRKLRALLQELGIPRVAGILLDLGVSSVQLERPERGFSFAHEAPLDMRMDQTQPLTAERLVNSASEAELARILQVYGEERFARRIARRLVQERRVRPIRTTGQLSRLTVGALPPSARHGRIHAATRTFQALRMAVNQELEGLEEFLPQLPDLLEPGGRAVILSFHSLEDRAVKQAFAQGARNGAWRLLTKKPLRPGDEECARNPRARSAKLRAVERC